MSTVCASISGATDSITSAATFGLATLASKPAALATARPSPQAQSAGRMSVAMPPRGSGRGDIAARTASAASSPAPSLVRDVWIQAETGFATASMSDVSGAS